MTHNRYGEEAAWERFQAVGRERRREVRADLRENERSRLRITAFFALAKTQEVQPVYAPELPDADTVADQVYAAGDVVARNGVVEDQRFPYARDVPDDWAEEWRATRRAVKKRPPLTRRQIENAVTRVLAAAPTYRMTEDEFEQLLRRVIDPADDREFEHYLAAISDRLKPD